MLDRVKEAEGVLNGEAFSKVQNGQQWLAAEEKRDCFLSLTQLRNSVVIHC